MDRAPAIAVIDIGKTNAKLVALDAATGAERETLRRENAVLPGPPYPHCDTEGLWAFIIDGLGQFASRHAISGISITTHGATAALLTGDTLALPVLDYEYEGPETTAGRYGTVRPSFAETLSPVLPAGLNLGAQIFWQATEYSEQFSAVTAILPYPQYWAWRLTGIRATETTSLGCHTDLWNPQAGAFSSLVTTQGWQDRMPPLKRAGDVLGTVTPEVAARTGLPDNTPVACGIHDSNASLVPWLNAASGPLTVVSSGTWTIVMTLGGTTDKLDPHRDSLANVDALGRAVPTARFMGGREFEAIAGKSAPPATPADAEAVIDAGVIALPSWAPGTGPFPQNKGRWHGSVDALAPEQRAAAASLYLALMTRECLRYSGQGDDIVVEGPLARNTIYCGALAALTGANVRPSPDATGTSTGAAMLLMPHTAARPLPDTIAPLAIPGLDTYASQWQRMAAG